MADVAVISTDVGLDTEDVETAKVPLVWPNAIVILAGTDTAGLLLDRLTCTPPRSAGTSRVTVPVAPCPPVTEAGLTLTSDTAPVPVPIGLITSVAVVEFADVAVMVAVTEPVTEEVDTLKVPLDWPCGIVMLAGTVAAPLLLDRFTNTPPAPAAAERVTVPVELWPALTSVGFRVTPDKLACPGPEGLMVSEADAELVDVAVIRAVVALDTGVVEMLKVPVVWPSAIVMLAGTVAAGLLLDRLTCTPPKTAGDSNVTVPVALWPPVTVKGLMLTPEMAPVPAATGLITMLAVTEFAEFAVIVARTDKVIEDVLTVKDPLD